jgi:hypothetical protein
MIDKITGKVRYAVMEFGGFLGIGTDLYPFPWDSLKYDPGLGGYVVSVTKEQLESAPHYEGGSLPDYTDDYGRRVYGHYDIPYI